MPNEPKEEKQSIEGISIPAYFDRYVTSEFRALEGQIVALRESVDQRFESVDRRFEGIDRRFEDIDHRFEAIDHQIEDLKQNINLRLTDLEKHWDAHFSDFQKSIDLRFADIDRRFDANDKRLERIEGNLKWSIGLFAPVIIGIVAMIIKQFFG